MRSPSFVRAVVCALVVVFSTGAVSTSAFAQSMGGQLHAPVRLAEGQRQGQGQVVLEGQEGREQVSERDAQGAQARHGVGRSEGSQQSRRPHQREQERRGRAADPESHRERPREQVRAGIRAPAAGAGQLGEGQERRGYRRVPQGRRARCAAERRALPGHLSDRAAADPGREVRRRADDDRAVGKGDRREHRRGARAQGERVLPHRQVPASDRHDEESRVDDGQAETTAGRRS